MKLNLIGAAYMLLSGSLLAQVERYETAVPTAQSNNRSVTSSASDEVKAYALLGEQKYTEAIQLYKKILKNKKTESSNFYNLAWAQIKIKAYQDALNTIEEALLYVSEHKFADYYRMRGNIYTELNQFAEGRKWHLKSLSLDPENVHTQYNLGFNYFSDKKYEQAIQYLTLALANNWAEVDDPGDTYFYIGTAYSEIGQYNQAITYLDSALMTSNFHNYYYNLAEVYQRKKAFDKGIEVIKQGIQHNPSQAHLYHKLSQLYKNNNQMKEYGQALQKAYQLDDKNEDILLDMGVYLSDNNDAVGAFGMYEQIINQNGDNKIKAYNNLITLYDDIPNYFIKAQLLFKNGIAQEPSNAHLHYNYGNLLKYNEKFKEAIAAYKNALKYNPSLNQANNNIGVCYMRLNDYASAKKYFHEGLKKEPDDFQINNNMAVIAFDEDRNYEAAIEHATKAINAKPEKVVGIHLYSIRANAHNILNNNEAAVADYLKLMKMDITDEEKSAVLGNLGYCYMSLNKPIEAKESFEKAWQFEPSADIALGRMLLAYKLKGDWEYWRNEFYRLEPSYKNAHNPVDKLLKDDYHFDEENTRLLKQLLK